MRKFLCFVTVLVLCSCSVKEDRSVCPCELVVRCEDALKTEGSVLVSVVQDHAVVKQGMLSREDFEAGLCSLTVPRRPSLVTVFTGITEMDLKDGRWLEILYENQCDELYSCGENADLRGERYECVVSLHKNFVRLFLTIIGMPEGASASVTGPVRGYDLTDQSPVSGTFSCSSFMADAGNEYCVRLPRQVDDELSLNIYQPGKPDMLVALGQMIAESGYSYDDPDLQDIAVTVDLSSSKVMIAVADWETEEYNIIEY